MSAATADVVAETADRLFASIARGDKTEVAQLWSEDIAVWRVGASRENDKARALRIIEWFITATTARHYEILDRRFFNDEAVSGFVQQHILHATGRAGQTISMRVCIVIRVGADGLIERIDEYFDPAQIAPLID